MTESVLAAINSVRAHLESQFLGTNQSIQECVIAFDNGFAALQGTRSSLPPPAGFPSSGHLLPQPPPSDPPPSYTDYGARLDEEKSKFHSGFRWAAKATPLNSVPPPQPTHTTSPSSPSPQIPIKRVSPSEIKEKWDRGLCYTCDQKGSQNQPTALPKTLELREEFEKNYHDNKTRVQGEFQELCYKADSEFGVHSPLTSRHPCDTSITIGVNSNQLVQPYHNSMIVHDTPQLMLSFKGLELPHMQGKKLISKKEAVENLVYKMKEFCHWWGDTFLEVSRRLFIFSLYALEEVYKDLILHLEDKVVLKG